MGRELFVVTGIGFVRVVQNLKNWKIYISLNIFLVFWKNETLENGKKYFLEAHLGMSVWHQSFYEFFIVTYISLFLAAAKQIGQIMFCLFFVSNKMDVEDFNGWVQQHVHH